VGDPTIIRFGRKRNLENYGHGQKKTKFSILDEIRKKINQTDRLLPKVTSAAFPVMMLIVISVKLDQWSMLSSKPHSLSD